MEIVPDSEDLSSASKLFSYWLYNLGQRHSSSLALSFLDCKIIIINNKIVILILIIILQDCSIDIEYPSHTKCCGQW